MDYSLEKCKVEKFMFAGNSIFTVRNRETQVRFTYRIKKCKDDKNVFFVGVLDSPDNVFGYSFIGTVFFYENFGRSEKFQFKRSIKSKYGEGDLRILAFNWVFNHLSALSKFPQIEFFHAGRCCRCGRTLTVPESILSGVGPECIKSF